MELTCQVCINMRPHGLQGRPPVGGRHVLKTSRDGAEQARCRRTWAGDRDARGGCVPGERWADKMNRGLQQDETMKHHGER